MVKIRLKRLGRKKRPFYRIVVMDVRARRQGAPLAELGYFNPLSRELKLDKQQAQAWVQKGALFTPTAKRLFEKAPETGELIILEKARQERLSKKASERAKQAAESAAVPEPVAAAEPPAPPPTEAAPEEVPPAEDSAPAAEEATE